MTIHVILGVGVLLVLGVRQRSPGQVEALYNTNNSLPPLKQHVGFVMSSDRSPHLLKDS